MKGKNMIHAYHSKKGVAFTTKKCVINVRGLPLSCLLIGGEFFFDVVDYLLLFDHEIPAKIRAEKAHRMYRNWRENLRRKSADGVVVATTRRYYANIAYLTELTRDLELVKDNGTLFTTTTKLEHEDGAIAIYRGIATPPDCVLDSKAGYQWSDFFEVKHNTLLTAPHKSDSDADHKCKFNIPVVTISGCLAKPEVAEDMPEVIKVNHPVNKVDVLKETELIPVNPASITSPEGTQELPEAVTVKEDGDDVKAPVTIKTEDILTGFSALVGQLVRGKKIKLTVTLELE